MASRLITRPAAAAGTRSSAVERFALQSATQPVWGSFLVRRGRVTSGSRLRRQDVAQRSMIYHFEADFPTFVATTQPRSRQRAGSPWDRLLPAPKENSFSFFWSGCDVSILMPLPGHADLQHLSCSTRTCQVTMKRQDQEMLARRRAVGVSESGPIVDLHLDSRPRLAYHFRLSEFG